MNISYAKITSIYLSKIRRIEADIRITDKRCDNWAKAETQLLEDIAVVLSKNDFEYSLTEESGEHYDLIKTFWQDQTNLESLHHHYIKSLASCFEQHPQIKDGVLMSIAIQDVEIDEELLNVVVLIKLEDAQSYFKLIDPAGEPVLSLDEGWPSGKMGKVAMILDQVTEDGYAAYVGSETTKANSRYWIDEILNVRPADKTYQPTQEYIDLAKTFIKDHIYQEPVGNQAEKHGVLYDAGEFFKKHEQYDDQNWQKEILQNKPERIEAWDQYKESHSERTGSSLPSSFGISNLAVKENQRFFKSVLKLDKNFHVYIHGDRTKIEHGEDADGKKFYKLYYDEER